MLTKLRTDQILGYLFKIVITSEKIKQKKL